MNRAIEITNPRAIKFRGAARLYKVYPPMKGYDKEKHNYVIVSKANVMFSGPETYIFGANEKGEVTNWLELDGSGHRKISHEKALESAGYSVTKEN